jgi:3-phosphoshikimate 1-carboxyvinyltransferase
MSHRAIMLGGIAKGRTTVTGLLEGEDVLRTVAALQALGAVITKQGDVWTIDGTGLDGLQEPAGVLDMGNSGTAARLLIGLLASRPMTSFFTGDASLAKRPMGRVTTPLQQCGAAFMSRAGGKLPLVVQGAAAAQPITYTLPVASAQVKSAILLAGLSITGMTTVIEPIPTRDHSEHMLRHFGARLTVTPGPAGDVITIHGPATLMGQTIRVPGDISSAAFPLVAGLLVPGSTLLLEHVGLNPRRAGLLTTLQEMGADIEIRNQRAEAGEPVGDLAVRHSALRGVVVPPERAPSMIDEYPVLAIAAACAQGTTRMCGLGELRVKESDRLALTAAGLQACGVRVEIDGDDLIVHGTGQPPQGGALIATAMDHRIAMSFLVLGLASREPIRIDDGSFIATSFPDFTGLMNRLGATISSQN